MDKNFGYLAGFVVGVILVMNLQSKPSAPESEDIDADPI